MKRTLSLIVFFLFCQLVAFSQVANSCLGDLCRISVRLSEDKPTNGYLVYEIPIPQEGFSPTMTVQGEGQPKLWQNGGKAYICIRPKFFVMDMDVSNVENKVFTIDVFVNKWLSRLGGSYSTSGCIKSNSSNSCKCSGSFQCEPRYCSCSGNNPCYYHIILDVSK